MESGRKRILAVTLVFIFILSALAVSENDYPPSVATVDANTGSNTSPVLLAYVPASFHQYVGNQLNNSKIPYTYYGNLLNVNDSSNRGSISYIFSMLNRTFGIQYFIFNSSDDFVPYEENASYLANPYTPANIYDAYDMNYIHNQGYYGNNTTIAVVDAYGDPTINYDVSAFDNLTGLPAINLNISTPEGAITSTNSDWASETAIDVEWSHAMAPGAKINLVLSPGDGSRLLDSVAYAVTHHLGNIISISWGQAESQMTAPELSELNSIYRQAAEENITVVAASGDQGANDGTSAKTVNFPASDPYVLGVGGTTLTETSSGYTQTAWGETVNGKVEASGGGFSSYFPTPYYQVAPNYTESERGVPDVSLDANPNTGVLTIVDGKEYTLGGTSIATPMWAGIIATMDQYYNRSLGLVNPIFYKISETKYYTKAFTPITSGGNYGYSAGPGWNPVTGLGTPLISNLINDTGLILNGYGTVATFNNTTYATGISTTINVSGNSVEQYNGSTFYYTGFYKNPNNYIKFGILTNETGYYYEYSVYENGTKTYGIMNGSSHANIGVTISGSEIEFTVNGAQVRELNMPLVFAGEYRAAVGAQQDNARINFVNIPAGTYSHIRITNETENIAYSGIYQQGYSNLGTSYSNITFSYNSSTGTLTAMQGPEADKMIYGTHGAVHIDYTVSFGVKSTVNFSLSNGGDATYTVNGVSTTSSTSLSGGYYNVVATESTGNTISREIYIPSIKTESVTLNYTPSYASPKYTMVVDGFFKYTGSSDPVNVYELGSNNFVNVSSTGFHPASASGNTVTSVTMTPEKVLLDVFVSNGNVTVTMNGKNTENRGGYHYLMIKPGSVNINVSKAGYSTYNRSVDLTPGESRYVYVLLTPDNKSLKKTTGTVENIQYDYNLSNANITYNGKILGYTNQSGRYVIFLNGTEDLTFHEYLYNNNTTAIHTGRNNVVYMSPASVSIVIVNFKITYSLPLGFYFAFVSWDKYPLNNFAEYVISYSDNSLMLNPHAEVITSSGTDFAFLPGMTPGKTYYVTVDAYSSNGSFISSNEISVHYSLISYLINVLILLGILAYIIFIVLFFMRRKKRKKELEDEEYEYFKYN
ncbi:MAG: hypothetical protein RE471_09525 [Ferroplasma sp.]|uniref:S8 family serine peptidase n=1 Tax=Ferroplasma sp. TaxID=2591003 RepID=UPI002814F3D9|nr:S8 family serine peptidase [Ferroplasma sp.]WMT51204.1 MAG: hypothetical protein RE471_09525 [Ferroplasma sp.]